MTPEHEQGAQLLWAVWRGMPPDYKSRYRRTIWQQFENEVRAAAYTSRLGKFINSLCRKLGVTLNASVEPILNSGQDRALLKLLRDETTLLVLMVRVRNEARRDEWEDRHAQREAEEAALDGPLFEEVG